MGLIEGEWHPYPDVSWLIATSASATLTFALNELQTFSVNGTCNITLIGTTLSWHDTTGNTEVTFVLYTSNDFFDSYIELETFSIVNLGDFIKEIANITIPPVFGDLVYVTNEFELILSSFNDGSIKEGEERQIKWN